MTEIVTDRLEITELTPSDASFIVQLLNSPGWLRFIGDRGVKTLYDAVNYIVNGPMVSYAQNGFGLWAMRLKESKEPIGMCGLIKRDFLPYPDLGFAVLPQYSGMGYTYEAAQSVLQFAVARSIPVLGAITNADNEASLALLNKIGFTYKEMITYPGEEKELKLLECVLMA